MRSHKECLIKKQWNNEKWLAAKKKYQNNRIELLNELALIFFKVSKFREMDKKTT